MIFRKWQIHVIIIFVTSCVAYNNLSLESEIIAQWLNLYSISKISESVVLDVDSDCIVALNDFIKSTHHDHSMWIIRGQEMPKNLIAEKMSKILKQRVNLVLSIKYINSSILDYPLLKVMLNSPWSILLITMMTNDARYKCDQGNFTEEASKEIEVYMNEIWQKYRMMFVIFALPYVCPNHYVVFHGFKPTSEGVYNRTIKLLNPSANLSNLFNRRAVRTLTQNYPLKGNIFDRFPTAITECSGTEMYVKTSDMLSGGYCGLDGLVMTDVVRNFGFNLTLPVLGPGYNKYGYQRVDGVITGSLGYVVNGDLDVSFNSRFLVPYVDGHSFNFLYPISQDDLCALTKSPAEQPLWLYPYGGYNFQKLFLVFSSLTILGVFMWITAKIESKIHNRNESNLFFYIKNATVAGLFGFFLSRINHLLLYRWLCLFISITLIAIYQSYINYWFTTRWYDYVTTLSELVDMGTVIQTSPSINALLETPANDVQATLLSRTITLEDTDSFEYVLNHPNTATLDRHTDAIMLALMHYMGEDGKPKLYVINQSLRSFYISYITNQNFPFSQQLHVFMMRLVESGLPDKYYTWTSRSLGLDVSLDLPASEPRPAEKITLGAQIIAFSLLFLGYLVSTVALAVEIGLARRNRPYPYVP